MDIVSFQSRLIAGPVAIVKPCKCPSERYFSPSFVSSLSPEGHVACVLAPRADHVHHIGLRYVHGWAAS